MHARPSRKPAQLRRRDAHLQLPELLPLEPRTMLDGAGITVFPHAPRPADGYFALPEPANAGQFTGGTADNGHAWMRLNDFRSDPRFARFTGRGMSTVVLDTGIDAAHPFFGPDRDGNGVADRIVYQYDFANMRAVATDLNGHGSNVASAVASSDGTYQGIAPEANIIALRVFNDAGQGSFTWLERALQWTIGNVARYNIASINLSLGDGGNWQSRGSMYGVGDELATLANMGVIVVAAAGNSFYQFNSVPGVSYPASDPSVISVGALYGSAGPGYTYAGGAKAISTVAGAITPFSQRSSFLDVFAPGAPILGAGSGPGGVTNMHGTSQASPQVAGMAVVAQQMAMELLGRRLTLGEFRQILTTSGRVITDGDDEVDNVTNTGATYRSADMQAMGEAILRLAPGHAEPVANEPPTMTQVNDLTGGVLNRRARITYNDLASATNAADPDGDPLSFRIGTVSSGSLTLNGRPVRPGITLVRPGDSLVWAPPRNTTGTLEAFTIVASDGQAVSGAPLPVRIAVNPLASYGGVPRAVRAAEGASPASSSVELPEGPALEQRPQQWAAPAPQFLETWSRPGVTVFASPAPAELLSTQPGGAAALFRPAA